MNPVSKIILFNRERRARLLAIITCFSFLIVHRSVAGTIIGSVFDVDYGGEVSAATISVVGQSISTRSDLNGKFRLDNVPDGNYTVMITAEFYKSTAVENVEVRGSDPTRLDAYLVNDESDVVMLDSVTVQAKELVGSDLSLKSIRRNSPVVLDSIGEDSFSKFALGDAAEALGKVTGISIVDGKYMVVRGLSDRYNNTTMNGATVSSADPDKRAVQLDQFPTGMIESVTTVKNFAPNLSGNFAGGYVDIKTKSIPDRSFATVKFSLKHDSESTGKDYLATQGGGDDWLAKDDGTRAFPEIANRLDELGSVRSMTPEEKDLLVEINNSFQPEMEATEKDAPLGHGASFSFGSRLSLGENGGWPLIGVVGSLSNGRSFSSYTQGATRRYDLNPEGLVSVEDFEESKGVESNEWGAMLNMAYMPGIYHEFGLNTSFNRSSADEAIYREGGRQASGSSLFRVRNLHFTERTQDFTQLYGKHKLEGLKGLKIDWHFSRSESTQDEPDFRLFYDEVPLTGDPVFTGNFSAPRRYWRALDEQTEEVKVDFTLPILENSSELKFGYLNTVTERNFDENAIIYNQFPRGLPDDYRYLGDVSTFLDPSILSLNEGEVQRYVVNFTGNVPRYVGDMDVGAFYAMGDLKIGERWRAIFGARYEETDILIQSFNSAGNPNGNDGDIDDEDWLPSLSLVYTLNDNSNIRLAASRTLARPNFRELSPFGSFDNIGGENFVGNPDLILTSIDNFDLRYEIYGDRGDLVALSLFTKNMDDPIERNFVNGELTYVNAASGEVSGAEFEWRKEWRPEESTGIFSAGVNVTYVSSSVQRSLIEIMAKEAGGQSVEDSRELEGQSDVIGNIDLTYENLAWRSKFSLAYNYTGERLYAVSQGSTPDVYEAASNSLNFTCSRDFTDRLSIKLSVKNLLEDSPYRYHPLDGLEYTYSDYSRGITTTLGISYDIR